MKFSSKLTGCLVVWIILMAGGASALAIPNQREGDTILPPDFEYGQGPEIAGAYYPPFGSKWNKAVFGAKDTYLSSGNPHSSFPPIPTTGFSGKHSIDMNVSGESDPYIYATFDGVISEIKHDYDSSVSSGKHSGQVLYLYDSIGKNQAIFAHIRIDRSVLNNYDAGNKKVTKGMVLGRIATKENLKEVDIDFDLATGSHLHYQLWINGKAQTGDQIEAWKY